MSSGNVLLIVLVLAALYAVLAKSLIKAAIGLAFVSVILTIIIFLMNSPFAAIFELSVCAGLITVVFISVISLTRAASPKELGEGETWHYARYVPLVMAVLLLAWALLSSFAGISFPIFRDYGGQDVRQVLWGLRSTDILGQLSVMFAGVYGVIVLFKELKHDE